MKKLIFIFIFLMTSSYAKLCIVTSFTIIENIVREVAQDNVDIKNIVGRNQDTHSFEPTPQTSQLISQADIIFINGLNFESWFEKLIKAANYTKAVVDLSQDIQMVCAHKSNKRNCIPDPHVWMNVKNVILWVTRIETVLSEQDPTNAKVYEANALTYIQKLHELHQTIQKRIDHIKQRSMKVITAHDAFNYFEHAYGLTFLAPQGLSPQDEPSAQQVSSIIKLIKVEHIPTIFVENITSTRLIEQIANEAKIKVGGILYSDALSNLDEPGSTYYNLMNYNTNTICNALK